MAQQINLHTPILLRPQRIFSARTMSLSLGVLAAVLALACTAVLVLQQRQAQLFAQITQAQQREREQLQATVQKLNQRLDPQVLAQQLRGVQLDVEQLQQQLAANQQQQLAPGERHSAHLALLAATIPPAAWLTQLRLAPGQWEITGMTLDTAALERWIQTLDAQPALQGRPLRQLRVEQLRTPGTSGSGVPGTAGAGLIGGNEAPLAAAPAALHAPAWAFRLANPAASAPPPSNARPEANR